MNEQGMFMKPVQSEAEALEERNPFPEREIPKEKGDLIGELYVKIAEVRFKNLNDVVRRGGGHSLLSFGGNTAQRGLSVVEFFRLYADHSEGELRDEITEVEHSLASYEPSAESSLEGSLQEAEKAGMADRLLKGFYKENNLPVNLHPKAALLYNEAIAREEFGDKFDQISEFADSISDKEWVGIARVWKDNLNEGGEYKN